MGKATLILPVFLSMAAFVLVLVALLAGSRPGRMEDFDIVRFNTSQLGKNLINFGDDDPSPTVGGLCTHGFLSKLCNPVATAVANIESSLESSLQKIENKIADKLADELGIHEFYSVHPLTICEGEFTPNTTAPGAKKNVTHCTKPFAEFNVSKILDRELGIGPWNLSLEDITSTFGVTDDIYGAFDTLHDVTMAFSIIFIISVALAGLSFLMSLLTLLLLVLGREERMLLLLLNFLLSAFAASVLLASAIALTIGTKKAVKEFNEHGEGIGLAAYTGSKFEALMWFATALMLVVFLYWIWRMFAFRRRRRSGAMSGHKKG